MHHRDLKALFGIYRFSVASSVDLGEDIPDLLNRLVINALTDVLAARTLWTGGNDENAIN